MKFPVFQLLVVGVGLAIQQADATPIRVVIASSGSEVVSSFRFGLAAAPDGAKLPMPMPVVHAAEPGQPQHGRRPCGMKKWRVKIFGITSTFRKALGWPESEHPHGHGHGHGHHHPMPPPAKNLHILPFPAIDFSEKQPIRPMPPHFEPGHPHPHHHHGQHKHHGHHRHRHGFHSEPFLRRVHHALMALGPWEGRAVAFVLGCGIGVLLRMIWVMTVVTYRMLKGNNDEPEAPEYTFVCEHYAEEIQTPPPHYVYEKGEGEEDADVKQPLLASA